MEKTNTGCLFGNVMKYHDDRGWFTEICKESDFHKFEQLKETKIKQVNLSFSFGGVVRGMHFQWRRPQGKLIRIIHGRVTDCVIDLRADSPTYGKLEAFELGVGHILYVPPMFAHGFWARTDTHFLYSCTEEYDSGSDGGISPVDESFKFPWLDHRPLISSKDYNLPTFEQWKTNFGGWKI